MSGRMTHHPGRLVKNLTTSPALHTPPGPKTSAVLFRLSNLSGNTPAMSYQAGAGWSVNRGTLLWLLNMEAGPGVNAGYRETNRPIRERGGADTTNPGGHLSAGSKPPQNLQTQTCQNLQVSELEGVCRKTWFAVSSAFPVCVCVCVWGV